MTDKNEFLGWAFPNLQPEEPKEEPAPTIADSLAPVETPAETPAEKVIEPTQNDEDWMRSLPGYQESEAAIHERLAEEHAKKLAAGEVDQYGTPIKKPETPAETPAPETPAPETE